MKTAKEDGFRYDKPGRYFAGIWKFWSDRTVRESAEKSGTYDRRDAYDRGRMPACYLNLLPQFLHVRLFMSVPRYFLHEGHLQLKKLKAMNAAITMTCAPKMVFLENSPNTVGLL